MNQSAITMLQKTIELMDKETCIDLMPEIVPSLLTVIKLNFFRFFVLYLKKKLFKKGVGFSFSQSYWYRQCKCMRKGHKIYFFQTKYCFAEISACYMHP